MSNQLWLPYLPNHSPVLKMAIRWAITMFILEFESLPTIVLEYMGARWESRLTCTASCPGEPERVGDVRPCHAAPWWCHCGGKRWRRPVASDRSGHGRGPMLHTPTCSARPLCDLHTWRCAVQCDCRSHRDWGRPPTTMKSWCDVNTMRLLLTKCFLLYVYFV